jgi:hypothetical protein
VSHEIPESPPSIENVGQVHYYVMFVGEFAKTKRMDAKDECGVWMSCAD